MSYDIPRQSQSRPRKLPPGIVFERVDVGSSAGEIIGFGGARIDEIQETCDVMIGISPEEISGPQTAEIEGTPENVRNAKYLVLDYLASFVTERVDAGSSARLIIGHRGETIRNIKEACNVTAGIVGEVGESQRVELSGKPDNVIRAKKMIEDILASYVVEYVNIGRSAEVILRRAKDKISEEFHVNIRIVGTRGRQKKAEIKGFPEAVSKAKHIIEDIRKERGSLPRRRSRLRSPLSSHEPWSIGKGGASKQIIRPKPNKRYPDITEHIYVGSSAKL
eukprot:163206_1